MREKKYFGWEKRGCIEIGDVVFAAQDNQERVGDLMFLCDTQCHVGPDAEKVIKEALKRLTHPAEEEWDDEKEKFVPVHEPERAEDLIVWALIRVA